MHRGVLVPQTQEVNMQDKQAIKWANNIFIWLQEDSGLRTKMSYSIILHFAQASLSQEERVIEGVQQSTDSEHNIVNLNIKGNFVRQIC